MYACQATKADGYVEWHEWIRIQNEYVKETFKVVTEKIKKNKIKVRLVQTRLSAALELKSEKKNSCNLNPILKERALTFGSRKQLLLIVYLFRKQYIKLFNN